MARKQANIPKGSLFIVLLIVAIALQVIPQSYTKHLNFFYKSAFGNFLNIEKIQPLDVFKPDPSEEDFVPRHVYNTVVAEGDNLRAKLISLNEKYEKLAAIKSRLPEPGPILLLADVIPSSKDALRHEIIINKGQREGITPGRFVLGDHSLIGTVVETTEFSARVKLVTDSTHRIEIRIWRPGRKGYIPGQMIGDGKASGKIPLISREYDVEVGDVVYAAAKPGFLDVPIVIGRIVDVKPDENEPLLLNITVKPLHEFEELNSVAVILSEKQS